MLHKEIENLLNTFYEIKKIPNIIFYGENKSGKKTLLYNFLSKYYITKENFNQYVMIVNCSHGKGIKFIREELKFFAKTQINFTSDIYFKSIILLNADKLTIDAQSALRRCIELFNHSTRFFIILEDKNKLLKPILSRFSHIHVSSFVSRSTKYHINLFLKEQLEKIKNTENRMEWMEIINEMVKNSISCLDVLDVLEKTSFFSIDDLKKYDVLFYMNKIKKEIRNEKILLLTFMELIFSS